MTALGREYADWLGRVISWWRRRRMMWLFVAAGLALNLKRLGSEWMGRR